MLHYLLISTMIFTSISTLEIQNQNQNRLRNTKYSSSTIEPSNSGGSIVPSTPSTSPDKGTAVYRVVNSVTGSTCILLKTDAVVEVKFLLHDLEEQGDSFIPSKSLVDGDCKDEETQTMRISWTGYSLLLSFTKTPGGERWYLSDIELAVSPDLATFRGIQTHGKPIKLYRKDTLIPTPVGKSYSCKEVDIELFPDENDHPPPGLHGTLLLRLLQVQPFMYKSEDFQSPFECKPQKFYRDETAPIAVGSTLAIAVLMTITGYGIFRYFKVKNVQYNTME